MSEQGEKAKNCPVSGQWDHKQSIFCYGKAFSFLLTSLRSFSLLYISLFLVFIYFPRALLHRWGGERTRHSRALFVANNHTIITRREEGRKGGGGGLPILTTHTSGHIVSVNCTIMCNAQWITVCVDAVYTCFFFSAEAKHTSFPLVFFSFFSPSFVS